MNISTVQMCLKEFENILKTYKLDAIEWFYYINIVYHWHLYQTNIHFDDKVALVFIE